MIEALKSNTAFVAECKRIYGTIIVESVKPAKNIKQDETAMKAIASFSRTALMAFRQADEKHIIRIRQMVAITINHVLMMSDPRIAERMVMDDFRKRYMDKIKNA
jgi:hypothetical protein